MPRSVEVYLISELDEEARKRAIDEVRTSGNCVDPSSITEFFADKLKGYCYPYDDIAWSLNCCQGDGMAFYGRIEKLEPIAKRLGFSEEQIAELKKAGMDDARWSITRNSFGHHYSHWNTMQIEVDSFYNETDEPNLIDKLEEAIKKDIQAISRDLESQGYGIISVSESDEKCIEIAAENGYYFTVTGKRWRE